MAINWVTEKAQFVSVAIYLRGYGLNPEHVSQVLSVRPSRSQKKGGFRHGSTKYTAKIGVWTLNIKSKSHSISELVGTLLQTIGNPPARLDEIEGVEEAYLDVFVPLSQHGKIERTLEFALTRSQIEKLTQLGLSACFTIS
ncbi:MAG TPA: DUF4279 domain-containing protein [Verrucomicrobiae bacterium]|nr:DUF4279 domain-containing protein [Verrucomicrobiae bacterium]